MRQGLLSDPQFGLYAVAFFTTFAVLHNFLAELLHTSFQLVNMVTKGFVHTGPSKTGNGF